MNRRLCVVFRVVATLAGCSGESGRRTMRVRGDVSYAGKPIDDGTIEFTATDGSHASQGAIKGGKYDIPAPAGPIVDKPYKVAISVLAKTGKSTPSLMPGSSEPMQELTNTIPPEYNGQTTLSATPTADKTQFDFKLEKREVPKK